MGYTIDIIIALADGEEPTRDWWNKRYQWGATRAGGFPPEVASPKRVTLRSQTDPDSGERSARVTVPLPDGISRGRANELCHMLSSVLTAEGYTLKLAGKRVEDIPGEDLAAPEGFFGPGAYTEARVSCERCVNCAVSTPTSIGCCTEGCAFSLADIGAVLLAGAEGFAEKVLALPGEMDGVKWHPYLAGGKCTFHDPNGGCTLPRNHMPLQCRTYLCLPDKLLPANLLADYEGYVDALEEQEMFVEEHMRYESGVDFGSPLDKVKEAAARAFAAWAAGER